MESSYGAVTKQIMESSYGAVTKQIMESCYGAVTSLVYRYAVIGFRFGFLTSKKPVRVPYRIKQYTRSLNHDFNISSSCLAGKNHALPQHLPNPVHFLSIRRLYFHSNAKLWSSDKTNYGVKLWFSDKTNYGVKLWSSDKTNYGVKLWSQVMVQ